MVWEGGALPRVFLDLVQGNDFLGRVKIELWPHKAPKSAENFRALCTGERGVSKRTRRRLHYKETPIHALFSQRAIMGGDTSKRADGKGGESIWLDDFEDRSGTFAGAPLHDRPGIVSMGNPYDKPPNEDPDEPNQDPNARDWPSFGSRFSIFLIPEPLVNGRHPALGIVVEGLDVLIQCSERPTDVKPRAACPLTPIFIGDCGEVSPDEWQQPSPEMEATSMRNSGHEATTDCVEAAEAPAIIELEEPVPDQPSALKR